MTVLLGTNSLYAFAAWTNATEQADSGYYDSNYVSWQIELESGTIQSHSYGALTECWLHFENAVPGWSSSSPMITFYKDDGTPVVRLYVIGSNLLGLQWWNGSTWNNLGSGVSVTTNTRYQFDVHIKVDGASSELDWYLDKAAAESGVADYSAIGNIDYWTWHNLGSTGSYRGRISQVILTDTDSTINYKFSENRPTGNSGTNVDWSGSYTDIDEFPVNPDDFISSGTANQVSTFTADARTWTGVDVKAVVLEYYPLKGNAGPQQIQSAFRIGGTNYFGSTRSLLHGFKGIQDIYETDPSTGVAWAASTAADAALEFGVKSIA